MNAAAPAPAYTADPRAIAQARAAAAKQANEAAIGKVAEDFEAFFASAYFEQMFSGIQPDPVTGGGEQFMKQLVGVSTAAVFAFVLTYVIALIIHKTIGLRVSESDEIEGLDIALHGESGYNLTEPLGSLIESTSEGHAHSHGTKPAMA